MAKTAAAEESQILDETISFWHPWSPRKLTREDARQIRENLTGFFRVLASWDAEQESKRPS